MLFIIGFGDFLSSNSSQQLSLHLETVHVLDEPVERAVLSVVLLVQVVQLVQVDAVLIILYFLTFFRNDFGLAFVEFQWAPIRFNVEVKALLIRHDVFEVQEVFPIKDHLLQALGLVMQINLELAGKIRTVLR